jgi:hypothetical protein
VLERTHGPYAESVRRVDEEQLLRNLLHIRYNETPEILNVTSLAAQYELAGQAEARPFFLAPNPSSVPPFFRTFMAILPDVGVSGANRPTVTLTPGDDGDTIQRLLTPITPDTMVFLARTSWPVSSILRLWVERLNGVPNAVAAIAPRENVVPDYARFQRIAELLQVAQDQQLAVVRSEDRFTEVGGPLPAAAVTASAVVEAAKSGLEYRPIGAGQTWHLVRPQRQLVLEISPGADAAPEVAELLGLLNLQPGLRRYDLVVVGRGILDPLRFPREPSTELRATLRSTAQVYYYLANGIEVPPEHLRCGLVHPPVDDGGEVFDGRAVTRGLFEVHSCKGFKPPHTAFVAVKYRGYWFYLDDRDEASKATFALVLQLSRLDFGRQHVGGPVLTLPVGR